LLNQSIQVASQERDYREDYFSSFVFINESLIWYINMAHNSPDIARMMPLRQKKGRFKTMKKRLNTLLQAFFLMFFVFAFSASDAQEPKSQPHRPITLNHPKPNPFDSTTVISYELSEGLYVETSISDRIGYRVVAGFAGLLEAGHHEFTFDARGLPYGPYMFTIRSRPTRESPRQGPILGLDLFYTGGMKSLTTSKDEDRRFNQAFTNILDDPPRGVQLIQSLLNDFPNTIYKPPALYMMLEGYTTIYKNPNEYPSSKTGFAVKAQEIMEISKKLAALSPTPPNYNFAAQKLLECRISLPKALEYAKHALSLNEKGKFYNLTFERQDILQTIGRVYLALDDPKKALDSLRKCLLLCDNLLKDTNYASSGALYERTKAIRPSILLDLGKAYSRSGGLDKAEQVLSEAFFSQPSNKEIFEEIKAVYVKKHGALKEFDAYFDKLNEKALSMSPPKSLMRLNRKALEFELSTLSGTRVKLSDFKGKPVVLNFWGYWCGACKEEIPLLKELWDEYRERGLIVLAVHFDPGVYSAQENREKLEKFIEKNNLSFPILMHEGDLASRYGGSSVPATFLIDKNGFIQYEFFGFDSNSDMAKQIKEKVKELLESLR
jgi:peroxiredoxin